MPAFSPDGTRIAFVGGGESSRFESPWNNDFNRGSVYVKLLGPRTDIRITDGPGHDSYPAWSPDGQSIAFHRRAPRASGYYIVSAFGGLERRIAATGDDYECAGIAWSPDGKTLVVAQASQGTRNSGLTGINIDTGEQHPVTTLPAGGVADFSPRFAPDGRALAFIRKAALMSDDIYILPAGGAPKRLYVGRENQTGTGVDSG